MWYLFSNIAIWFDFYVTFFVIFIIQIIAIGWTAVVWWIIWGFIYKSNFWR